MNESRNSRNTVIEFPSVRKDSEPRITAAAEGAQIMLPALYRCAFRVGWGTVSTAAPVEAENAGSIVTFSGHKGLIRLDNGRPLAVVGSGYTIVQNDDLVDAIGELLMNTFTVQELAGVELKEAVSYGGRECFFSYRFPSLTHDIGKKSEVALSIIFQNSFGSRAISMYIGAIDFFCQNGLVIGEYEQSTARHTKGLTLTRLATHMNTGLVTFAEAISRFREWSEIPVSGRRFYKFIERLEQEHNMSKQLGGKLRGAFNNEVVTRDQSTVWEAASALSYYASHNSRSFRVRSTEADHTAVTLLQRKRQVNQWMRTSAWKELAEVA